MGKAIVIRSLRLNSVERELLSEFLGNFLKCLCKAKQQLALFQMRTERSKQLYIAKAEKRSQYDKTAAAYIAQVKPQFTARDIKRKKSK
jgi:hypothetical protein